MDFSIILPSYNEADNLPSLLRDIKERFNGLGITYEIIVVDDGSTDNTQDILIFLSKETSELNNTKIWPNAGFGAAVIKGLSLARGDVLGFMDADGQIEAKYLLQLFLKLTKDGFDFCKAKRVKRDDGFRRVFTSKIYNLIFKITFGGNIDDVCGKPKIFTKTFYDKIKPIISKRWFIDSEIIIKAIGQKSRVGELPIVFLARKKGFSKAKFLATASEYLKNIIYWRFVKKN